MTQGIEWQQQEEVQQAGHIEDWTMLRVVLPVISHPLMLEGLDYFELRRSEGQHDHFTQAHGSSATDACQQAVILQIQHIVSREVIHVPGATRGMHVSHILWNL